MKSSLTRIRHVALATLLALGLAACAPRATALPSPTATAAPPPSPATAPSPAPSATVAPPPSPASTPSPATTPTPSAMPMASSQGGSKPRPAAGLRRLAAWGDGVPVAVALSPDGVNLYVATALRLARHDAGKLASQLWSLPLDSPPAALALSPDGATLALARDATVELRAAADGALLATLPHGTPVADVAFAPDGATLAAALDGATLALWDLAKRRLARELRPAADDPLFAESSFTSVAFAPDGRQIAAGDTDGNITFWSPAGGPPSLVASVGLRVVRDVAYAPDGSTLAAASEGWRAEAGAIWLFAASDGAELGRLTVEDATRQLEPVVRVAFSADGATVIAGTSAGAVLHWSWPDGALLDERPAHRAAVSALAPTPGGGLISAGRDGDLRRWNSDGARIDQLDGLPAVAAVAAGRGLVFTGGEDGTLALWGVSGAPRGEFAAHSGPINALALSPDGALLASAGDDGAIRLWALPGGEPRGALDGHAGPALALAFAPDGSLLASAGWDGTVRVWAMPEGAPVTAIEAMASDGLSATAILGVALDQHGQSVAATAYDGAVRRFPARGGPPFAPLLTGAGGWLIAIAATAQGYTAALDDSGLLWAWDAAGAPLGRAALADASSVAALADGRLLTAGVAGGLRLWALDASGPAELSAAASAGDSVATTPLDDLAAVGSRRGFVEVWALPDAPGARE